MKTRWLGWISLLTLISVTLWLMLLIWDMATAGPLETFPQVLAHVQQDNWIFPVTYMNAAVFTIFVTALMAGLYVYCSSTLPELSIVGMVFVPVYSTLNLIAYLSQITLVPALLESTSVPAIADTAYLLLEHTLQILPGSTVAFFNNLAYAILGIPSMLFGWTITTDQNRTLMMSGWLLILNGIACILGFIGVLINIDFLSFGTILGGAIFWLSLFPMSYIFLRRDFE
jgi:hypothetical protein